MNIIDKTHRAEHLRPVPGVIDRLYLKGFKNYKAKDFGNTDDATREERWRRKSGKREDEGEFDPITDDAGELDPITDENVCGTMKRFVASHLTFFECLRCTKHCANHFITYHFI